MDVTAYIGEDRAIYFGLERVGPGDELFGQPFAYWRALLEADVAREVARWHSLSRKRGRTRRA